MFVKKKHRLSGIRHIIFTNRRLPNPHKMFCTLTAMSNVLKMGPNKWSLKRQRTSGILDMAMKPTNEHKRLRISYVIL